jgi:hypothetical protein
LGETDSLLLPNLQTVEQAQQLCKQFLLWPIYDYNAISTKLQVLHNVLQLVVGEEQNFTAIATKLSSFLREATEQSSLAPLHFEPFQRLLWYFDSDSLKVSGTIF